MTKKTTDKTSKKQQQWVERTAAALGVSEETTSQLLSVGRRQSVRVNPFAADPKATVTRLRALGCVLEPVPWLPHGYTVTAGLEAIKASELIETGAVYIQNAASWLPVVALGLQPNDTVLDVCAVPGGKTSHMAAVGNNQVFITANDNSRPRLAKMRSNLNRLGVENVDFTLFDASQLAKKLAGKQFDKILLDAPCSGEGMMTLQNSKDFETWSVAHIKRLQQLQKRILVQAWQLLKPSGTLVYSTCTMAPEENEAVIDYLLRHNENAWVQQIKLDVKNRVAPVQTWNGKEFSDQLKFAVRLVPSPEIESFFVCKLTKNRQYAKM